MTPSSPKTFLRAWSSESLKEFHRYINSLLPISFMILERDKSTSFFGKNISTSLWLRKTSHVLYKGFIPEPGFDNISVIFTPVKTLEEEFNKHIGYIEVVNNIKEDAGPCAEIRCFFQEDLGIDTAFNEMMIESRMFNSKMSPVYIYPEQSYCLKDKPPEELLKKKIPIKEISTFHKIYSVE
ncbi:MAG TPA: hypothetical protein VMU29_07210 [Smithella sp.]|nr:hypothetical protein [Smithella sp.]